MSDKNSWKASFGLLPIHLNPLNQEAKYLMLNGGYGDFCLQTSNEESNSIEYFSDAWSTNTKNYVYVGEEKVKIFNWLSTNPEIVNKESIESNFGKFYRYLLSKSYRTEKDVIPFIIDLFRQIRNITLERREPSEALSLLFRLLISLEEDSLEVDMEKWNISDCQVPHQFDFFAEKLKQSVMSIQPKLDLILRHTSGVLFQEAHKEVLYFNPQRDLFGNVSSEIATKKGQYTSIHYTPQFLARSIVENSIKNLNLDKPELKVFDPACGSSEFLIEALKQLKEKQYQGRISIIGWDTSESAINSSKFLLQYEKRTQWGNGQMDFTIEVVEDSLTKEWDDNYDLILMNPPFVSWELLKDKNAKEAVRSGLGEAFKRGKPNQASAFFFKSILALGTNGVIGCVLPSSIFTYDSYKPLRDSVQEIISIKLAGKLGNFVFEDALTDVSFFIGKKPPSNFPPQLLWTKNEKGVVQEALRDLRKMEAANLQTIDEKKHSIYTPTFHPVVAESWKIISLRENSFLKDIRRFEVDGKLSRISEIFSVKQGIRQGKRGVFKISLSEFDEIPQEEKYLFRPVVDNDAIKSGKLFRKNYIWYPYKRGGAIFTNEEEIDQVAFFRDRIKPLEEQLKARKGINEWWGHTRPRNWQFQREVKLVSTEFGKSDSFAFDKDGDFVVERGNAWIPKRGFNLEDYYFYLSVFSSRLFDTLLSIFSKAILSGWYLGKENTQNIPIPNVHSPEFRESPSYKKLVDLGKDLEKGNSFVKPVIDEILTKYYYPEL